MDVIFETQKGTSFCIEIGFFDTVLEIKEKIQKYRDIPVTQQTLILDGKVLEDDGTVESCNIFQNSHIRLIVVAHEPEEQPKIKIEEQSPVSMKVQLLLRLPTPKSQKIAVQMELSNTVEQLKKKINEIEGFPANRLVLHANENTEMQDHTCLHEYHLTDGSEIDITVRPSSATSGSSAAAATAANVSGSKRLKVMILPPGGTKKMAVEVGAWEKVQVLRNELEKLQKRSSFDLPEEYFFIYNQAVMEERESFRWHGVCHGDTIEIFSGSVTVGS